MTRALAARGAELLLNLTRWRSLYDFDAPGLTAQMKLRRLRVAVLAARKRNQDPRLEAELDFALNDCQALLALRTQEGDLDCSEQVARRIARIRRVAAYHEGAVARLNRRYWWLPFSVLLALMLLSRTGDLAPLFRGLLP